jgi:Na+/H+ antiporter nhaC
MKSPSLLLSITPILVLIGLLFLNVVYFDDPLGGANQIALMITATVSGIIAVFHHVKWETIQKKILGMIDSAMPAILILLLIGALSGTWMLSGVIPTMIYYGVKLMSPAYFLVASVIICSIVSVATGSSWSTIATVGVAIIGIGNAFNMNPSIVAGAVISGAYFGDKMSPLSDTTNLASAIAGTDIFTHIRYLLYTTTPTYIITLVIFAIIGLSYHNSVDITETDTIISGIEGTFHVTPWLLLVPVLLAIIIIKKVPPVPAMLAGITLGVIFTLIFQPQLMNNLILSEHFSNAYQVIVQTIFGKMELTTGTPEIDTLLSTRGMEGMLNTVWLIVMAMVFSGVMEAGGFLKRISEALLSFVKNDTSLISTTISTCILFNITSCDQYLSIVVPGKMTQNIYKERGLKPEVLSRALEDSATVTSVLVPWNTCGATQARVLGVATLDYLPYCFFNLISPMMNIFITSINYKIRRISK